MNKKILLILSFLHKDLNMINFINIKLRIKIKFIIYLFFLVFIIFIKKANIQFFLLTNQELNKLNFCKKYGLLVYDYFTGETLPKGIGGNIGDYIQSLAALQFLPRNCRPILVDRDTINLYHGPKIKIIMNGWYRLNDGNKLNSEYIYPVYESIFIYNHWDIDINMIKNLIKYEPIGCRDLTTLKALNRKGIKAYFSSCLTTTLDIDYKAKNNERNEDIIFVDYRLGDYPEADNFLYSLKAYNFSKMINITHSFNLSYNHIERLKYAKELISRYAKAKLVTTTRIHAALPCLALQTPVIFINSHYDYYRFPGLYELFNTIGVNYNKTFKINVNLDKNGFVYNSDKYLIYANNLKDKLKNI